MICFLYVYLILFHIYKASAQIAIIDDSEGPLDDPVLTPSNLQVHRRCENGLGLESGDIPDDRIAVSSTVPVINYGKEQARLNGDRAWVALALPGQWIEVDLGKPMYVSGVKTQGKFISYFGPKLWITAYKILYKMYPRQAAWLAVSDDGSGPLIFDGNTDSTSVKTSFFQKPIQAELIRVVPMAWPEDATYIALRLELTGCQVEGRSGCGSPRVMTNPTGYIFSMNFPNKYENNANCRWNLKAPDGQIVMLEFVDEFHLEGPRHSCRLDYVEVIDVIRNVDRSLGKFCGSVRPGKFSSSFDSMKVHFLSDHYENYSGFKAHYSFVNGSKCESPQLLQGQNGTFHSMNYPENYDNFANCVWDIYADPDKLIEITFSEVRIRGIPGTCTGDSLQITKVGGIPSDSRVVRRICGITTPEDFLSTTNHVRVVFQSNRELTDRGFQATYKSVFASGCGKRRERFGPRGTISSLNYPFSYPNNIRCEWNIIAGPEEDIRLRFLNFDLEEDQDCQFDHVSIFDGKSERHLLGKYCNKLNIQPLVAHSGTMKIIFESDMYNVRSGFEASYVVIPRSASRHTKAVESFSQTTSAAVSFPKSILSTFSSTSQSRPKTLLITPKVTIVDKRIKPTTSTDKKQRLTHAFIPKDKPKRNVTSTGIRERNQFVTEELAKWILIGLVSVGSLVLVVILVGVVLCCRQHRHNQAMSLQGSLRNANSGMMQNHAYDFSLASTSQSIRSRQIDAAESSQVSETISHQDAPDNDANRDSHIYFSIDDYCGRHKQSSPTSSNEQAQPKIHFRKMPQESDVILIESDESAIAGQSEEELDDDIDDDKINDDNDTEKRNRDDFTMTSAQRGLTMDRNPASSSLSVSLASQDNTPKLMVENILYEATTSIEN